MNKNQMLYSIKSKLNNIQIGDLITAYHKGFHVVTKIERRYATADDVKRFPGIYKFIGEEYAAIIYYKKIANADYKAYNGNKIDSCDASWCKKLTKIEIKNIRDQIFERLQYIEKFAKEF